MPSYEMLTEFDFLDIAATTEFEPHEEIFYWEPDGRKVNEGYSRNFVVDYKNGLASFVCLWHGTPIDDQEYRVVSAKESWYVIEGEISLTDSETGHQLRAGAGQVITVKRGQKVMVNATSFKVLFICLNMPEQDMAKMTAQDGDWELTPIPGDGPTGLGPRTVRTT